MGMFDTVRFENHEYQTKDTPAQCLEYYEIRGDELWFKKVVREWVDDKTSFLSGYLKEVSHEWVFCNDFDGRILIYREDDDRGGYKSDKWIEYKILFMDGKILKCERIE
jgi:hypothetical protein